MENKITRVVRDYKLEGSICIVAVSGGIDSVVLLDALASKLGPQNIIVAHLNHGLRKESAKEALFVENLAAKYSLPYFQKELRLKKGDEATARNKRYKWLRELSVKNGAKYIITAHHLDDQAETILLNLVRGTGPFEIWGMREAEDGVLRPLLSASKAEILKYAKVRRLKYCQDASNKDVRYARNRLRANVLPELLKLNPALLATINNETTLGHEAADYWEGQVAKAEKKLVMGDKLDLAGLKKAHPLMAKEIIKRQLQKVTGKKADIYQKNVMAIYDLIQKEGSKETHLGSLVVRKTYKYLIFGESKPKIDGTTALVLNTPVKWNGRTIKVRIGTAIVKKNNILLPRSFSGNLKVRTWRAGDKISAKFGTKKIQDIFVDAKIDAAERSKWPIVTHKNEIIWVPGLIASKYAKKSKNNLIIEVK